MVKLSLIQDFTRYDQSKIWGIHDNYFLNIGIAAWTKGDLPYSGVCNPTEAYKKARLVIENLQVIKPEADIKIMELGAGLGEFANNFLISFKNICKHENLDYYDRLTYYFTDYAQMTLDEVASSHKLQEFQDKIQYYRFDVMKGSEQFAEQSIDFVLSSYLLDQLPARIFARTTNGYFEKYIKLEDHEDRLNNSKKPRKWIKKIKKTFEFREIDLENEIPAKDYQILDLCFRKTDSTTAYSYGALEAVKTIMPLLKPTGIFITSDFNASARPGIDYYEPCYYGNSLAQAVNFEFLFNYFSESQKKVLLYEDPIKPLHTLILTARDFPYAIELGEKYNMVYKQNMLVQMLYKFLVELQVSFIIFAVLVVGFILYWLLNHSLNLWQ